MVEQWRTLFEFGEGRLVYIVIKLCCTMKRKGFFDDNVAEMCVDCGSAKIG